MGNSNSNIKKEKKDSSVPQKFQKEWKDVFLREYPSGEIKLTDIISVYKQFFPFGDPTSFCTNLITYLSFDKENPSISFKNFFHTIKSVSIMNKEDRLKETYKLINVKGEETINKETVREFLQSIHEMIFYLDIEKVKKETSNVLSLFPEAVPITEEAFIKIMEGSANEPFLSTLIERLFCFTD
eukprot:GHVP01071043.1.p1 GENE.GHVP01071043.1~~GHVP01071043.1.p1  ORF type:complete len:184 (+),score=43.84 GHVP01071043.1:237-788(+)